MRTIVSMIIVLSLIGVISGGGLSLVSNWADPLIAANKKADTERAIFLVQPEGSSYEKIEGLTFDVYKVFDAEQQAVGYALPWEGNGFQGSIRMMIGLTLDLGTISSIEILEQVETPGLGTKIAEDPFRSQFENLNADPDVAWVKGTPPTKKNEIQTITGATISSKAIVAIINDGMAALQSSLSEGSK